MLEQERPGLRGTPARAPKSKGRAPSLGRSGQQPVSSSCRAALRFMQCLLLRLGLLDRLRPHSPSPGTCTDTQPAGDHRYTWLPPVQMASRGCRGSHRKDRTADSCSSTTKSLSFRTSQIQTALGMLSGEGRGPGLCSPPAPVQHPCHPNSPTPAHSGDLAHTPVSPGPCSSPDTQAAAPWAGRAEATGGRPRADFPFRLSESQPGPGGNTTPVGRATDRSSWPGSSCPD